MRNIDIPENIIEKFNISFIPEPNSGCWLWEGAVDKNGYDTIRFSIDSVNKNFFAHRISFIIEHGEIPTNKQINHKCDNKLCISPYHLYAGTQQDNMKDKIGKHRRTYQFGNNSPRRKLIATDAKDIQTRYSNGEKPKSIHKDYSFVGYSTITACCRKQNWKNINV